MGNTLQSFYRSCNRLNFQNITDVNFIVNCAKNGTLRSIISQSISPSEKYVFDFVDNAYYDGHKIKHGFQKLFVTSIDNNIFNSLIYEYYVNTLIVKPLTDFSINPHFVKYLGGKLNLSFDNIVYYLAHKTGLDVNEVSYNLSRNINYLIDKQPPEPIEEKTDYKVAQNYDAHALKYGFILNEGLVMNNNFMDFTNLENMENNTCITFYELLETFDYDFESEEYQQFYNTIMKLLFQVATACYALFLSKTAHNDLHPNNIMIKKIPSRVNTYNIDGNVYKQKTELMALLFDWDRSYVEGFNNPALTPGLEYANQTNNLIQQRDFVKVCCYVYKFLGENERDLLLNILSSNDEGKKMLRERYIETGCSLIRVTPEEEEMNEINLNQPAISEEEFENIRSLPEIIQRLNISNYEYNDDAMNNTDNLYICSPGVFNNGFVDEKYVLKIARAMDLE
jgi:hypothetical protein